MLAEVLLQVAITTITPTTVWPQVKLQGGDTAPLISRKLAQRFTKHGLAHQGKIQVPPQPSLPLGSVHKPFILIHQRADRMKTTITKTNQTDYMDHCLV